MNAPKTPEATAADRDFPETVLTVTIRLPGIKPETLEFKLRNERTRLRVGRDPLNEILIHAAGVAQFHAALLWQPAAGSLLISDLGSRNNTKLNGKPLADGAAVELENNAVVRFGDAEARFSWTSEDARSRAASANLATALTLEADRAQQTDAVPLAAAAEVDSPQALETAMNAAETAAPPNESVAKTTAATKNLRENRIEAQIGAAKLDAPESLAPTSSDAKTASDTPAKRSTSVARSAGVVSIAVMGSRVLGLVREMMFARFFGAGFLYDAFLIGFRIPNLLRDLFAEGALSAAFVKVFTDYQIKQNEAEAWRLASLIFNALAVVLSAITVLGILFSSQIVWLLTYNYSGDPRYSYAPEKAQLAATLMQIMFPFILLVALAALAMGVLNTKGKFAIPASASTAFNVVSILGGLGLAFYLSGGAWETSNDKNLIPSLAAQRAIVGMAIGTLLGGAAQLLIQVPSLLKVGFRFSPVLSFRDAGVRRVAGLMAPAILGVSAVQIKVLVDTALVSGIDGGQSWLSYAFRLMQFPIGVFGVALGTAAVPTLSRFASENDFASFRKTLSNAINLVFLLTIPSACGLIFLGEPIIRLIYQWGRFDAEDTRMTAWALIGYSIGLTGYAAIKVISPAFYALDDAKTPMIVSVVSLVVSIAGGYTLMQVMSGVNASDAAPNGLAHVGVALATSIVALVNCVALALLMRRKISRIEGRLILRSFVKIAIAAAFLSVVCYFSYQTLARFFGVDGLLVRLVEVFVPMTLGGSTFLAAAKLLGVAELNQAFDAFARKLKRAN